MPLLSLAETQQKARADRKRLRTGWRTGCSEESKTSALKLALSRLPRRKRRTFLDDIEVGISTPVTTAARSPSSTTCTNDTGADDAAADDDASIGEPSMPPSNPPLKRSHSPEFLDATPRKRVRIHKGERTKTGTDSDKKDEVHGSLDTTEINGGISSKDSGSLSDEELWDSMLADDDDDNEVHGSSNTAENHEGIAGSDPQSLSIEELWDSLLSEDDSLS